MDPQEVQQEIKTLLSMMGINSKEIRVIHDHELSFLIISLRVGADTFLLRENNSELLRALSTLFPKLLQKKYFYFKEVLIDLNGDELKLLQHTKEKAAIALERVEFFDKPYEFGYLNSYERMIIHRYLKKHPHVVTESHGQGKDRRLRLFKKNHN